MYKIIEKQKTNKSSGLGSARNVSFFLHSSCFPHHWLKLSPPSQKYHLSCQLISYHFHVIQILVILLLNLLDLWMQFFIYLLVIWKKQFNARLNRMSLLYNVSQNLLSLIYICFYFDLWDFILGLWIFLLMNQLSLLSWLIIHVLSVSTEDLQLFYKLLHLR